MKTIILEDHGQDFLEWDIDAKGFVVACRPFQGSVWTGVQVLNKNLRAGSVLKLKLPKRLRQPKQPDVITLKYRVKSMRKAA